MYIVLTESKGLHGLDPLQSAITMQRPLRALRCESDPYLVIQLSRARTRKRVHAIVSTNLTPNRQPLILPIEELSAVLVSSICRFLELSATLPSNWPVKPPEIASPMAPPTIAPSHAREAGPTLESRC